MKYRELDVVVLDRDIPEKGLRAGDLGAVVLVHGPDEYEVEFTSGSGHTRALVTLLARDLRRPDRKDAMAVRRVE